MTEITGTITFVDLSGGFWGIAGDDGSNWHPQNGLPASLRKEGLRIKARVKPAEAAFGIFMWGQQVDIQHIEQL